ncbi:MAG TPA: hypothetical protein PK402_11825 [Tepidisphaeraceae bacterium]|nr:hypothetical protein [Tepidisphaeraceae bacterium]
MRPPTTRVIPRTTWQVYKSRFIPIQILLLIVCLVLYFYFHTPKEKLLVYIIGVEFFAIVSAFMGARVARKISGT